MERLASAIILLLLFVSVSCSGIDSGVIVRKEYQPARTYTMLLPLTVSTKYPILVPYTIYDDADYVLLLEKNGETGRVFVSESVFKSVSIGNYFRGVTVKENNRKERVDSK